jgi:hypothetical protein
VTAVVYLAVFCRCFLGLLFGWSSVSKVRTGRSWRSFTGSLVDLRILPARLLRPAAFGVVGAEMATVVLLIVPATIVVGFAMAAVMLLGFAATIVAAVRRGSTAACACFGSAAATRLGPRHIVRNLVLFVLAVAGAAGELIAGNTPAQAGGTAIAVLGAVVAVVLVTYVDDIVALFEVQPGGSRPH